MDKDDDLKFPKVIAGEWRPVEFSHADLLHSILTGSADFFEDRRIMIEGDQLVLQVANETIRSLQIEIPPASPFPGYIHCDHFVRFSNDGLYIWHLGYLEGWATCFLLDAATLEVLDQFEPQVFDWSTEKYSRIQDWMELQARVHASHPNAIVIHSNAGDDISLLYGLVAENDRIINHSGDRYYEFARDLLDERIGDAIFGSESQLLILDDVSCITWSQFPQPEEVKKVWLHNMLEDAEFNIHVWPEHRGENFFRASQDLGIYHDRILVDLVDPAFNHPANIEELIATMVLDRELNTIGFMRPPAIDSSKTEPKLPLELTQISGGLFANQQGVWKPEFLT